MSRPDVIRAWKDVEYRASLSATEIEMLPAHPAGPVEISDADLGGVAGGSIDDPIGPIIIVTIDFCLSLAFCATVTICFPPTTTLTV